MTDQWRNHYDRYRLASPPEGPLDEDGEPIDQDDLDARAEDAAIERAERQREDAMFDAPDREIAGAVDEASGEVFSDADPGL